MSSVANLFTKKKKSLAKGVILLLIILFIYALFDSKDELSYAAVIPEERNYVYLSDLEYITENNWSYNGWDNHVIQKDKNQEGGILNLKINGERRPFAKGIGLHARGQVVYDISAFSTEYPRFTAKLGVDASRGTNGSIWFQIFVSNDGINWISREKTGTLTGDSDAVLVDIDVEGYKYLRIYIDPAGDNSADHGTIADAKLVPKDYVISLEEIPYDRIHRLNYYDEILGKKDLEYNYTSNYKTVLERELVNKLEFWNIQFAVDLYPHVKETLEWLLTENRPLEEVIEVGEITNSSLFLKVLSDLYHSYREDLKTTNGYVYEKMMIGLAAAYSSDRVISPLAFSFQSSSSYDYMERFRLMKQLFDHDQLRRINTNAIQGSFVKNDWFKDYHVQLMRMVMQDGTSNVDLIWLNGYTNEKQSMNYHMIPYVSPNYNKAQFYDEANREKYDTKYYLTKYNVPYGERIARYWMVVENGGICWNASRFAQSMYRVNGLPATGAYQPGHELYIQYYEDSNGNGYWTPRYGNWGSAGSTWGGANPYRYIFNWGNKYFADKHISGSKGASNTGYLYLGQANLNNLEQYRKSLYYDLIANSYTDDEQKLDVYFKSLEVNDINLDTYDSIITLYKKMSVKNEGGTITPHQWYELAIKITDAYAYHPVAMFDLLKVIRPYLEGSEKLHIDRIEKEKLTRATQATGNETLQVDGVRTHARQLLNKAQPDPVTFSFDGENAGKLVKNPIYQLAWGYSLDGGKTFSSHKTDDAITLTASEIASITSENDIVINFMGLSYTFTIDITEGAMSNLLFANDLENRVVGVDVTYEWRNNESDAWTSYRKASPDNTGNKTLYVRRGATGRQLATGSVTYTFTEDNQPNTRKYVPVSHLSISAVSTEATGNQGAATYAIDGNYNTRYHSAWNGTDTQRFVTIKLDKPRYVSAVEFVPAGGGNGKIYDGTIWGSLDGENWEILSQKTGLTYTNAADNNDQAKQNTKSFDIDIPKEIQYIKIVADRTNGNWFTARAFNIFQDLTGHERPTAGVAYSPTEPTSENVIARLVNVSAKNYEILSPGGDTHVFTENGQTFTFRFRDTDTGLEGSALAKVDWIDRKVPTAEIEFSTKNPTTSSVIATLKPSEEIKVLNNGYYSINEDGKVYDNAGNLLDYTVDENGVVKDSIGKVIDPLKYEFIDNGTFTFEFVDKAGNKGTATAKVDWIDRTSPVATLTYNKKTLTNEDVEVTISFNEEARVLNNNKKKTYVFKNNGSFTFEYSDTAGNRGSITAKVNWIDKESPTAKLKYENRGNKVIVRVVNPSEEITFAEGIGIYEFTKNGRYDIVFYDKAGNKGTLTALITSFKEESEKGETTTPTQKEEKPKENKTTAQSNKNKKPSSTTTSANKTNKKEEPKTEPSELPENKPINTEYNRYTIGSFAVAIPSDAINVEATLKTAPFVLPESVKENFGSSSEYYDLYLTNNRLERVDVTSTSPIKISIKRKESKEFTGIYEILEDYSVKPIDYTENGRNIEVEVNALGKYVLSYNDLKPAGPEAPTTSETKNAKKNVLWKIVGIVALLGIGIMIFKSFIKNKNKIRKV